MALLWVCFLSLSAFAATQEAPSSAPSSVPSVAPSSMPSSLPSSAPSSMPSSLPSSAPSSSPSSTSAQAPSSSPSPAPSAVPSSTPSLAPSAVPSSSPSPAPSAVPSSTPSLAPSAVPSSSPSPAPSSACADNPDYYLGVSAWAGPCSVWSGLNCSAATATAAEARGGPYGFSRAMVDELLANCPRSCRLCSDPSQAPTSSPTLVPTRWPTMAPTAAPTECLEYVPPTNFGSLGGSWMGMAVVNASVVAAAEVSYNDSIAGAKHGDYFIMAKFTAGGDQIPHSARYVSLMYTSLPENAATLISSYNSGLPASSGVATGDWFKFYRGSNFRMACTQAPTSSPTPVPTLAPTMAPSATPTSAPTATPTTLTPTAVPTQTPTLLTAAPTIAPTENPTATPSVVPTQAPTVRPTAIPTQSPTKTPTSIPTRTPTSAPSFRIVEVRFAAGLALASTSDLNLTFFVAAVATTLDVDIGEVEIEHIDYTVSLEYNTSDNLSHKELIAGIVHMLGVDANSVKITVAASQGRRLEAGRATRVDGSSRNASLIQAIKERAGSQKNVENVTQPGEVLATRASEPRLQAEIETRVTPSQASGDTTSLTAATNEPESFTKMVQDSVSDELGVPVVVDSGSVQVKDESSPTEAPTSAPYWVYGSWSDCPTRCGDGLQSRSATCYRDGLPVPDNDCLLEKDIVQQNCSVYDDCPLDYRCLTGAAAPDEDCELVLLGQQLTMALLASGLGGLALTILIYCICKLRRPKSGTYSLDKECADGKKHQLSWSLTIEATPSISTSASSGKTHVVWSVDEDVMDAYKCKSESNAREADSPPIALEGEPVSEEHEVLALSDAKNAGLRDLGIVVVPETDAELGVTVYENGQVLEYYSATLKRWVPAHVEDIRLEDGKLRYDVFTSRQARMDVPLPMLRPLLRRGEPVYLLDGDVRVACVVAGRQSPSCTTSGYQVIRCDHGTWAPDSVVEDATQEVVVEGLSDSIAHADTAISATTKHKGRPLAHFELKSASQLQRRFPAGSEVEVYRGPALGWCRATVREEFWEAPPPLGAEDRRDRQLQPHNCIKVRLSEQDPSPVVEAHGVETPIGDDGYEQSSPEVADSAPRETEVGTWLVRFSSAFLDRMVEDYEGPNAIENDEIVEEPEVPEASREFGQTLSWVAACSASI
eukprot:TRINITY_DN9761_c0_g1_i2.p1 TRINITY_DN9761_c0_g1~~TRINITY_DN9761_c0_g1_i2.p1  ORF type:complete len:1165 (+),score=173.60 TRINITY_DN9761_c0_g1_i2:54-3548(+)